MSEIDAIFEMDPNPLHLWRFLANWDGQGELPPCVAGYLKGAARKIVEAKDVPAKKLPQAIMRGLGIGAGSYRSLWPHGEVDLEVSRKVRRGAPVVESIREAANARGVSYETARESYYRHKPMLDELDAGFRAIWEADAKGELLSKAIERIAEETGIAPKRVAEAAELLPKLLPEYAVALERILKNGSR